MAISQFPVAVASSGAIAPEWLPVTTPSTWYSINKVWPAGVYRVRAYAAGLDSTATVNVNFADSNGTILANATSVDIDDSQNRNFSERLFNVPSAAAQIAVNMSIAGYVSIENLGVQAAGSPIVITNYSTSQTLTFTGRVACALLGGGGGGGSGQAGGGGGSGYIQKFYLNAGSYPLVVGAGGGSNTAGSPSTISTYTANGGNPGVAGGGYGGAAQGGAGGSGGSGTWNTPGNYGGSNGSTPSPNGGAGSGVVLPWWATPGAGGLSVDRLTSNPGGYYAGGGCGGPNNNSATGGSAGAGTGGGGGGGSWYGNGGTGGTGSLLVGVGA